MEQQSSRSGVSTGDDTQFSDWSSHDFWEERLCEQDWVGAITYETLSPPVSGELECRMARNSDHLHPIGAMVTLASWLKQEDISGRADWDKVQSFLGLIGNWLIEFSYYVYLP